MEKDAYYFPHFSNARHDRKIKRLRKELGAEGYGIYFMILEILREQTGFKYPLEDINKFKENVQERYQFVSGKFNFDLRIWDEAVSKLID